MTKRQQFIGSMICAAVSGLLIITGLIWFADGAKHFHDNPWQLSWGLVLLIVGLDIRYDLARLFDD